MVTLTARTKADIWDWLVKNLSIIIVRTRGHQPKKFEFIYEHENLSDEFETNPPSNHLTEGENNVWLINYICYCRHSIDVTVPAGQN
jgi:hypothetical protein